MLAMRYYKENLQDDGSMRVVVGTAHDLSVMGYKLVTLCESLGIAWEYGYLRLKGSDQCLVITIPAD